MPFDQLSLAWQVWGDGLLGAVLLALCCFVGIEWPWLVSLAHVAWAWARRTFTDPAPTRPHTTGSFGQRPTITTRADVVDIQAERQRLQRCARWARGARPGRCTDGALDRRSGIGRGRLPQPRPRAVALAGDGAVRLLRSGDAGEPDPVGASNVRDVPWGPADAHEDADRERRVITHYIPAFTHRNDKGQQQAACLTYVGAAAHSVEPTCPTCDAWFSQPINQQLEDADMSVAATPTAAA